MNEIPLPGEEASADEPVRAEDDETVASAQ